MPTKRQQLYLDLFVAPWQQMMSMMQRPGMGPRRFLCRSQGVGAGCCRIRFEAITAVLQKNGSRRCLEHWPRSCCQSGSALHALQRSIPLRYLGRLAGFSRPPPDLPMMCSVVYTGATDWFWPALHWPILGTKTITICLIWLAWWPTKCTHLFRFRVFPL